MKNIQLIAPASFVPDLSKVQLDTLSQQLEKLGYRLCYSNAIFEKKYFLAGCDETRLKDIEHAFSSPNINAILTIRGGEGSMRLLNKINYQKIKKHPKPLIGFSDITALQNALWEKAKIPSYTGFIGGFGFQKMPAKMLQNLGLCLENKIQKLPIKTIRSGTAEGILLGGNLTVLCALLGTPFFPKLKNNILLLEEVGEPGYRLDRLLNQLRLSGTLDRISGLILGDMTAGLNGQAKRLANQIIKDHVSKLKYPVVSLTDYSHARKAAIIPLGVKVKIDTTKNILTLDKVKIFD